MTTIELRRKVAELLGYTDISVSRMSEGLPKTIINLHGIKGGKYRKKVPEYENSLDAIYEVFRENRLDYALVTIFEPDCPTGYSLSSDSESGKEFEGQTPSIALCRLFIYLKDPEALTDG